MTDLPPGILYELDRFVTRHAFAGAKVRVDWSSDSNPRSPEGCVKVELVRDFHTFGARLDRGFCFVIPKTFLSLKNPCAPV